MIVDRLITAPNDEPVLLNEMREVLGITRDDDTARDRILQSRLYAAIEYCQDYCNVCFVEQTRRLYSPSFYNRFIVKPNLQSVTSITYIDNNDNLQTVLPSTYIVDTVRSQVVLKNGESWPADVADHPNAVSIEYVAGENDTDNIPSAIKEAIKFIVIQWENYQDSLSSPDTSTTINTVPYAVKQLLDVYRNYRVNNYA